MDVDLPQTQNPLGVLLGRLVAQHEHLRQLSIDLNGALSASKATVDQVKHLSLCALARTEKVPAGDEASEASFNVSTQSPQVGHFTPPPTVGHFGPSDSVITFDRRRSLSFPIEARPSGSGERCSVSVEQQLLLESRSNWRQRQHSKESFIEHSSQSSAFIPVPGLDSDMVGEARRNAIVRLRARLGNRRVISSQVLHDCLKALGMTRYSQHDIDLWVNELRLLSHMTTEELAQNNVYTSEASRKLAPALRRVSIRIPGSNAQVPLSEPAGRADIEFKDFARALLSDAVPLCLDMKSKQMMLTIREILFSGDANRLVAELTRVRVDDVAAPMDKQDLIHKVEPIFTGIILLNGAVIGLQTSGGESGVIAAWFWANVLFTASFLFELVLRAHHAGFWNYLFGAERWWNIFDFLLMTISLCDVVMDGLMTSSEGQLGALGALRVVRLARVTRLFRIFRMKSMRELNLMVRGILGGIYTLFWAVVVLFFTLYVIAVAATSTIRDAELVPDIAADELFSSVPRSLLTSFRCSMGDCTTSRGQPIILLLSEAYGPGFVLCYLVSAIFVHFGLFNLVAAVYVENTMNAARTDGERSWSERRRESVRIARLARQLLKKFCAAQKLSTLDDMGNGEVRHALTTSVFDDMGDAWTSISKELFLCVIQDPSVQKLMDDLDIPPDRAGLFDVLDADGSGGLEVTELITGLLRVRGEAKKHDVLGTLLAVRVTQDMLRDQDSRMGRLERLLEQVQEQLPEQPNARRHRANHRISGVSLLPGVTGRMHQAVA